jgi:hypothetical protein
MRRPGRDVSRGPGVWQRQILRAASGTVVASVSGVVRTAVIQPSRDDFTSARRATKQLALRERVSATYAYACVRCGEIQDRDIPEACCGRVRSSLAVAQPGRLKLLKHPAPPPGGVVPPWVNVVPPARPPGQLAVPSVEDLANLVVGRCYDGLQSGRLAVSVQPAVALIRLAHEIEHDAALAERDAARRQMEEWRQEWRHGLWAIRNAIVRQYGQDAWAAISAEIRKHRPAAHP